MTPDSDYWTLLPAVIDYPTVLSAMQSAGLRCVYPNSGAFGPAPNASNHVLGWIAKEDSTIRPEMLARVRTVPPPASRSLATYLGRAWLEHLPGPLWFMPASHWAYELQFGGADWLGPLLHDHGIDPQTLQPRADGSAIQFKTEEASSFVELVEQLLPRLNGSDFTVAFPGRAVVATLHHHQQIWWQTSDKSIGESLDSLVSVSSLFSNGESE